MDQLKNIVYLIPIPLIMGIMAYSVNYWNVTELEKKFMSNFQKLKINFSLILLASTVLISLSLATRLIGAGPVDSNLVIGGFILGFILLLVVNLMIWCSNWIFSFKPIYTVKLDDKEEENEEEANEWTIVKVIDNGGLLIKKGKNKVRILANFNDVLIERDDTVPGGRRKSFYLKNKYFYITVTVFSIILLCCAILFFSIEEEIWKLVPVLFFMNSLMMLTAIFTNLRWFEKQNSTPTN